MKKTVFFRNILILIFTLISLSCSNLFEQKLETPSSESRNAFITLSVGSGDGSRTVLPGVEESELTTLVLKGTKEGESESSLGSWASVSEMRNAAIPLSTGSWAFTLTAKKGGTSFCGSASKNITVGENSLSFEMKISDSGSGDGSFSITLNFESATNADKVTKAVATLENTDGSAVTGVNSQTLIPAENAVIFTASGITAGIYRAKVIFYSAQGDRDLELATYRELVQISDSLVSTAARTIESFDNLYTITYNLNGGVLAEGVTLRENVTRKSAAITLPELAKDYYTFDGWYTTENFAEGTQVTRLENFTDNLTVYAKFTPITYTITYVLNGGTNAEGAVTTYTMNDNVTLSQPVFDDKPFYGWYDSEDFNGNKVTGWSAGEKGGDITLYANWDGLVVTAENILQTINSLTNGGNLKAVGEFSNSLISQIATALKNYTSTHPNKYINLDLFSTTGITTISDSAFKDCKCLTCIKIPNSVTAIGAGAFSGCSNLQEISLPFIGKTKQSQYTNEYVFGYIFGTTAFTGGVKTLQMWKNGTVDYYIPSSLKNVTITGSAIAYSAFYGCKNIENVTIASSVMSIYDYAFCECTNLKKVIFEDTKSRWEYLNYPSLANKYLNNHEDLIDPSQNASELKEVRQYTLRNTKY